MAYKECGQCEFMYPDESGKAACACMNSEDLPSFCPLCSETEPEFSQPEAPEPEEPGTWTIFRIWQNQPGPGDHHITVEYESNDDDDDGYPDREVVRATYYPRTLEGALQVTGKSRIGLYGQPVDVYLDGEKI